MVKATSTWWTPRGRAEQLLQLSSFVAEEMPCLIDSVTYRASLQPQGALKMAFADHDRNPTIGNDQLSPYRTTYQVGGRLFVKPEKTPEVEVQLTVTSTNGLNPSGRITGYGPCVKESTVPANYRYGTEHSCTKNQVQHHEYSG